MAAQPNPQPGYPPAYDLIPTLTIPAGLELLSAHWFFRHGERTPVRKRLTQLGIPSRFLLCGAGREFAAGVINDTSSQEVNNETELMLLRRNLELPGEGSTIIRGDSKECYFGELTNQGRRSTLRLGQQLRELYVDRLKFLPEVITSESQDLVHFRSTSVQRAIESLQQCIHGLLPKQHTSYTPDIFIRTMDHESLLPNTTACAALRTLNSQGKQRAARDCDEKLLASLDDTVGKALGKPVRISSHPSANGVLDTIKASQAHGIPVPKIFDRSGILETMEKAIVYEWFNAYSSRQFAQLSMGRLWGDLLQRFEDRIKGSEILKLGLYGTHDTTLAGMLKVLGVFDDRWPAFTAYVSVELFRRAETSGVPASPPGWLAGLGLSRMFGKASPSKDAYVRLRYNSQDIIIPACKAPGSHLEGSNGAVCTLAAFKEALKNTLIGNQEWVKQCASPPIDSM